MEKNVSSVAEQDKTAEVKKNPKLIELAPRSSLMIRSIPRSTCPVWMI